MARRTFDLCAERHRTQSPTELWPRSATSSSSKSAARSVTLWHSEHVVSYVCWPRKTSATKASSPTHSSTLAMNNLPNSCGSCCTDTSRPSRSVKIFTSHDERSPISRSAKIFCSALTTVSSASLRCAVGVRYNALRNAALW